MSIEVEQKYRITDRSGLLSNIVALGATAQPAVTQVDTYFAHPARDFAITDEALRLRCEGDQRLITYKGPKLDGATKTRKEVEIPLAPGAAVAEQWDELLHSLSFRRVSEVAKTRQPLLLERGGKTVVVAIDQVQGIGDFVELEVVVDAEPEIEPARQLIAALAEELRLTAAERRSYLELLLEIVPGGD